MANLRTAVLCGMMIFALAPLAIAQSEAQMERIGRYQLSTGAQGLEVRRISSRTAAGVAAVAGVVLLVGAGLLAGSGGIPSGVVGGLGGLLLVFAGWSSLDRAVWHANPATLVREGFAGRAETWRSADIDALEVLERKLSGAEMKRAVVDRWEVRVRLADGSSVGPSLRFVGQDEARAAARALGDALEKSIR